MRQCRGAGRVRLACWAAGSLLAAAQAWAAGPTADANTARGVLRAENEAVLASPVSERIVQMPFREGDSFKDGGGKIVFQPNWFAPTRLGRLRERTFVTAPITYSAYRFVTSLFNNKGYAH